MYDLGQAGRVCKLREDPDAVHRREAALAAARLLVLAHGCA